MKILVPVDLAQNELRNAVLQVLASAPENPREGQIYYNSGDKYLYRYDGKAWGPVGLEYTLPPATAQALGGVKAGSLVTIAADGTISAMRQSDNNLTNALKNNYDAAYTHSQAAHAPANAQANVQSDWNATSGDAFIKNKPSIPATAADIGALAASTKGAAGGVAELDASGKVPTAQLPSYVDDVVDAYVVSGATALTAGWLSKSSSGTALTPESDKIYVVLSSGANQNKIYRWSGSAYAEISSSIALGETASTAYRGDRGKIAYDHSQATHAPANAQANVQSDWNATSGDALIKNKPAIPKAVTRTVKSMTAATETYTVSGYILSVMLVDSVTKEQVLGDITFGGITASANTSVTVTFASAPANTVLVVITSIAL